jgi:hypothetical protein
VWDRRRERSPLTAQRTKDLRRHDDMRPAVAYTRGSPEISLDQRLVDDEVLEQAAITVRLERSVAGRLLISAAEEAAQHVPGRAPGRRMKRRTDWWYRLYELISECSIGPLAEVPPVLPGSYRRVVARAPSPIGRTLAAVGRADLTAADRSMLEFVVDHGPLSAPALLLHLSLNPRVYYEPTPDPVYRPDQRGKAGEVLLRRLLLLQETGLLTIARRRYPMAPLRLERAVMGTWDTDQHNLLDAALRARVQLQDDQQALFLAWHARGRYSKRLSVTEDPFAGWPISQLVVVPTLLGISYLAAVHINSAVQS